MAASDQKQSNGVCREVRKLLSRAAIGVFEYAGWPNV